MRTSPGKSFIVHLLVGAFILISNLRGINALGANKNAGTSAAPFLKIGAGARPAGMGGAFTAVADDVNALAWNPAGLGILSAPQMTAMHTQWFQGANFEFLAAAHPSPWGTFGVGFKSFTIDDIEKRTSDTDAPEGSFNAADNAYIVSYGKRFKGNWAAGGNLTYIHQNLDGRTASGFSTDIGGIWKMPGRPLTIALSARNVGPGLKFDEESDPLPTVFTLGTGYHLFQERLKLALDAGLPRDGNLTLGVGTELSRPLFKDTVGSLRAGYNTAGTDPTSGLSGISLGLGLIWPGWAVDAAYVPYGNLGNTFRYSFLIKF